MTKIDYTKYSLSELREALDSINAKAYPENYKNLITELEKPERKNEAVVLDNNENTESGAEILKRVFLIFCSVIMFFASHSIYSKGVIHSKSGREMFTISDNPVIFHLGILLFISSGVYLLYAGFFGSVRTKNA